MGLIPMIPISGVVSRHLPMIPISCVVSRHLPMAGIDTHDTHLRCCFQTPTHGWDWYPWYPSHVLFPDTYPWLGLIPMISISCVVSRQLPMAGIDTHDTHLRCCFQTPTHGWDWYPWYPSHVLFLDTYPWLGLIPMIPISGVVSRHLPMAGFDTHLRCCF